MRPRLGFLGLGWIGRTRLAAIAAEGDAEIVAIADPSRECRDAALAMTPGALGCEHFGKLLELPLDGIVIATPSALHAEQSIAALERGYAVFCQKPLARTGAEARHVVDAAARADRLLGIDLSYRETTAAQRIREELCRGAIGRVFAVDLVFHNAYGPDAAWFYDKRSSGGGCVIDLGIHLVDLALWLLDFPSVVGVQSELFASGEGIDGATPQCEDFATVTLRLAGNVVVRLACSWGASAGREAVIGASLYGTGGTLVFENIDGSLYDFAAVRHTGARTDRLVSPPDEWGGRAAVAWVNQLAYGMRFDPEAGRYVEVARVVDQIYACAHEGDA